MKNWTIKKRIILGFTTILALFAVLAVTSLVLLKTIKGHQADITDDALPGITASGQIKYLVCEIQLSVLRHLGVEEALITCRTDNAASIRVIEKCGGRRIDDADFPERPDLTRRRYLIPLV